MTVLCNFDDIQEDQSKGFTVNEQRIFAVKKDGRMHVYQNWCPHLGINLEYMPDTFLDREKRYIECANHGALFEVDTGMCVVGPCTGQALRPVAFEIKDNKVIIDLAN